MVSDLHMSNILEETKAGRQKIFENICSLLVSAGYFRARIPALSPFDKVFTFKLFPIASSLPFINASTTIGRRWYGMVFNR